MWLNRIYLLGILVNLIRPGSTTAKDPVNLSSACFTNSTMVSGSVDLRRMGNLMKITLARPAMLADTSHPKSLSSVSRTRPSLMAICMTSSSEMPGQTSTMALISCQAARSARTTAKSQLSSARNRIACFDIRRTGLIEDHFFVSQTIRSISERCPDIVGA